MNRVSRCQAIAWAGLAVGAISVAHATPWVVRGSQLTEAIGTPELGRGYFRSTNTVMSPCVTNVNALTPTFDFVSKVTELRSDAVTIEPLPGVRVPIPGLAASRGGGAAEPAKYQHRLLVTSELDVYYQTLDDSSSALSAAAVGRLEAKDLRGFFETCGTHYVRTISRKGVIVSVISYGSDRAERDYDLDAEIKATLRRFDVAPKAAAAASPVVRSPALAGRLTIDTQVFGLGDLDATTFTVSDITLFRDRLQTLLRTGASRDDVRLSSLELAPWTDYPEFWALVRLEPVVAAVMNDGDVAVAAVAAMAPPAQRTKKMRRFEQRRTLLMNAELVGEIQRATHACRPPSDPLPGAETCLADLAADGMMVTPYMHVASCRQVEEALLAQPACRPTR